MSRIRDPREKKLRSYERDCRNIHAESGSAARKAIAKRKAGASQALRKAVRDELASNIKRPEDAEEFDLSVQRKGRKSFRKRPDSALAQAIYSKIRLRPRLGLSSVASDSDNLQYALHRLYKRTGR